MRRPIQVSRATAVTVLAVSALAVFALLFFVSPLFSANKGGKAAAITRDQADTILGELKEIRRLLERMEQQGGVRSAQRRGRPTTATVSVEKGRPTLGSSEAPVTVVEFTDYQCPFCRRFVQSTFPLLKRDYIDTGKVRWVIRDMPLALHPAARKAAQAGHCAGEQDKFWEMRDTLFRNSANLDSKHLRKYAQDLSLDISAFDACLASDRHLAEIDEDGQEANRVRITGTPTFVVGKSDGDELSGRMVIGAQAPGVFTAEIRRVMQQTKPPVAAPAAGEAAQGRRVPAADS